MILNKREEPPARAVSFYFAGVKIQKVAGFSFYFAGGKI